MPRKASGNFDQQKYVNEYIKKHIVFKNISLNRDKPEDMEVLEWLSEQPEGVSPYMKRLIREDMAKRKMTSE